MSAIRFTRSHLVVYQTAKTSVFRIFPSAFLGARIGDVSKVHRSIEIGKWANAQDTLLTLQWDGFRQTEGDELYHTQWANVNGVTHVTMPMDVKLVKLNEAALEAPEALEFNDDLDTNMWLAEVEIGSEDKDTDTKGEEELMGVQAYAAYCKEEHGVYALRSIQFEDKT